MHILGIEADKAGFSFVVLSRDAETLAVADAHRPVPANLARQRSLAWVYDEIRDISLEFQPMFVGIKRADIGMNLSNAILDHAEVDGVIQAALGSLNLSCETFQWKSLAAKLGSPNKAAALTDLKDRPQFYGVARSRMGALGVALIAGS